MSLHIQQFSTINPKSKPPSPDSFFQTNHSNHPEFPQKTGSSGGPSFQIPHILCFYLFVFLFVPPSFIPCLPNVPKLPVNKFQDLTNDIDIRPTSKDKPLPLLRFLLPNLLCVFRTVIRRFVYFYERIAKMIGWMGRNCLRHVYMRAIMPSTFGLTHPRQDDKLIFLNSNPTP